MTPLITFYLIVGLAWGLFSGVYQRIRYRVPLLESVLCGLFNGLFWPLGMALAYLDFSSGKR